MNHYNKKPYRIDFKQGKEGEIIEKDSSKYMFGELTESPRENAGNMSSIDGKPNAKAVKFVHTYSPLPEENRSTSHWIYSKIFIGDSRKTHAAYLLIPTIDYFKDGKWNIGLPIAKILVPKDQTMPYTYIGTLSFGKLISSKSKDKIVIFRLYLRLLEEKMNGSDEESTFEFKCSSKSIGFWWMDTNKPGIDIPIHISKLKKQKGIKRTMDDHNNRRVVINKK